MRRKPAYRDRLAHRMENIREALTIAQTQWRAGNAAEAAAIYQRVLDCAPDNATALHQLGVIAQQRGQSEAAEELFRRAAKAVPNSDLVWNNLGVVLEARGKFADAAASYERALALNPNRARVHFNLANALRALGRWSESEAAFRRALELDPRDVDALHNLAALHKERGDREQAEMLFRQVLALAPQMLDAHVNLGSVLQGLGRDAEALACFREALRLQPGFPDAVAAEAGWLERHGEIEGACERVVPLIKTARHNPDVATTFATLAPRLGREIEAVEMLKHVLGDPTLLASKRQAALFALGKLFDKLGRYEEAFHHYRQGNELNSRAFDPAKFVEFSERVLAVFDTNFLVATPRATHDSELPIFVVGMPRSGTSLVEQILASHPAVFGAGELPAMEKLSESLPQLCGTREQYPECLRGATSVALDEAAAEYLAQLRALAPEAQRVVDKMPGNFLHVGFIALLFPRARIIHIRRDALDNCLSCYFQNFNQGHEYSYDLATLGRVYREYERIMDHWRNVARLPLLEIRYEDLIVQQEGETRQLLDFCGLDWDPRCLRFHETRRIVRTASYDQVRRPIYGNSVGRHRNYEAHLGPLREALAETGFPSEAVAG
jgi:tetratricopeptide (TPR) repeat protein